MLKTYSLPKTEMRSPPKKSSRSVGPEGGPQTRHTNIPSAGLTSEDKRLTPLQDLVTQEPSYPLRDSRGPDVGRSVKGSCHRAERPT